MYIEHVNAQIARGYTCIEHVNPCVARGHMYIERVNPQLARGHTCIEYVHPPLARFMIPRELINLNSDCLSFSPVSRNFETILNTA